MNKLKLVVVVPCYNEEAVLSETTRRLLDVAEGLKDAGVETRVLYVDDGSADGTWRLVEEASARHDAIGGLRLAHNVGHQHALWAGLETAATLGDAVVTIDADMQDDPAVMADMVQKFREGCDVVFGVRNSRATDTFFKRHSAQVFYRLMQNLGCEVVYNHADYRLMSRRAVLALMQYGERNLFLRGLVKQMGFKQGVVGYDRAPRTAGESKYPLRKMLAFAWDGITSFSVRPLRIILTLGLLFILVALGVIVWALVSHWTGHTLPGWTSLLVSVWFVGGAVLMALGIIGEYIGKIYSEVKRRPRYFIDKKIGTDLAGND